MTVSHDSSWTVAPGVTHTELRVAAAGGAASIHVVEIDAGCRHVSVRACSPGGGAGRLDTVGSMLDELGGCGLRVVAGVNADFFNAAGVPAGLQISDGEIATSPAVTKVVAAVMAERTVRLQTSVSMHARVVDDRGDCLAVDAVNRPPTAPGAEELCLYTNRFAGCARLPGADAVVVASVGRRDWRLRAGRVTTAVVRSVGRASSAEVGRGTFVLVASGGKAHWLLSHLTVGRRVRLAVSFDKGLDRAQQAISGNGRRGCLLLRDGRIAPGLADDAAAIDGERHPRTLFALRKGRLCVVTADGRQAGHSDGMTIPECAELLLALGMDDAINVDGGGSTALHVRCPGDELPVLVNRPSDGFERPVANCIAVTCTAPRRGLAHLVVAGQSPLRILAGGSLALAVKGHDRFVNAVAVDQRRLSWEAHGEIGSMSGCVFTAGREGRSGRLCVSHGRVRGAVDVEVVDSISALVLEPARVMVEPGQRWAFLVEGRDRLGNSVHVAPELLEWGVEGRIGSVERGVLSASEGASNGAVVARMGVLRAEAAVQIGGKPSTVAGFDRLEDMDALAAWASAGSAAAELVSAPRPPRGGAFSLRLTYDFADEPGPATCGIRLFGLAGNTGREVEGAPRHLAVWVCRSSSVIGVRLVAVDAAGADRSLPLVERRESSEEGWQYLWGDVPEDTQFPVTVGGLTICERDTAGSRAGFVCFRDLRAHHVRRDDLAPWLLREIEGS